MPSMWEDLKKTVKSGLSTAAAKTEEYTKIGKAKLDMMNLNKTLSGTLEDLGLETYTQINAGAKGLNLQNTKVKEMVEKIGQIKQSIKDKESEIEAIKKAAAAKDSTDEPSAEESGTKAKK
jgi:hypothetical protein